jgi:hypothetical protein
MIKFAGKLVLPHRPHLHHLRKQAKARLVEMRALQPDACLADAQCALAREYGFASWAKLRAEVFGRAAADHAQDQEGRRLRVRRRPFAIGYREPQRHEASFEQGTPFESQAAFFRAGAATNVGMMLILIAVTAAVWGLLVSIMG